MPSSIRVFDPAGLTSEIWIEKPFLTIGSGPTCDIRLESDEVAPSTANVRFREGQFLIFNQNESGLTIDGSPVNNGASTPWRAGQTLTFHSGFALQLIVDGDPAPSRKPIVTVAPRREPPATPGRSEANTEASPSLASTPDEPVKPKAKGIRSTEIVQLMVILLCVAGGIAVLATQNGAPTPSAAGGSTSDFAAIVDAGEKLEELPEVAALIRQAQAAEFAYRRNDTELALGRFARLKTYLAPQDLKKDEEDKFRAFEFQLLKFVEGRLSRLH